MVRSYGLLSRSLAIVLFLGGWGFPNGLRAQAPLAPPATAERNPEANAAPPPPEPTRPVALGEGKPGLPGRPTANPTIGRGSILKLFARANPMVWLLALCSVVTLGFALERVVALRRERVMPRDFVQRFLERLASGKLDRDRAVELCRANDSPAARVFAMVVGYWGQPAATIRQSIGHDAAGELNDLKRNVRVLNGTATLAPLLGLLGTVIGMIQSFEALGGRVGPARGEALAQGISLALVTTAFGLAIAVVSVAMYYYLLNRVDLLVRALDDGARKVVDLVSAEAIRSISGERRVGSSSAIPSPSDHVIRHETRIRG
jgi:biopolymer transport protein ExbB